jgi:hypothetical protein
MRREEDNRAMDTDTLLEHLHINTLISPSVIESYQTVIERMTDVQREVVWTVCEHGGSLALGYATASLALDDADLPPSPELDVLRALAHGTL